MINDQFSYFHINHKNKMSLLTEDERTNFIMSIYTTLASLEDEEVGKEINKFFDKLIPNNSSDLLLINKEISDKYFKNYPFSDNNFYSIVNKFLGTDFRMHFEFNKENTEILAKILVFLYKLFKNKTKAKKYNLKSYQHLLIKINETNKAFDAVSIFLNKDKLKDLNSFISTTAGSLDRKYSSGLHKMPSFSSKSDVNSDNKNSSYSKNTFNRALYYQYPNPSKNIKLSKLDLPVELYFILNKLVTVKKLTFSLDSINQQRKEEILLILLNSEWVFPNVFEIEFDLQNEELEEALNSIFQNRLDYISKKNLRTTNYESSIKSKATWKTQNNEDNEINLITSLTNPNSTQFYEKDDLSSLPFRDTTFISGESGEEDRRLSFFSGQKTKRNKHTLTSLTQYVSKNLDPFETVIIYSYFAAKMKNIKLFSLIFQDTYKDEIERTMKLQNIILFNFNFLNFILKLENLTELSVEFNSLDMKSFEKIISLIHKNSSLQKLRISFFSAEKNYSPSGLYKLYTSLQYNSNALFFNKDGSSNKNKHYQLLEADQIIVNELLQNFEENIEKLFFILLTKLTSMNEITLFFDIPSLITENDMYIIILLKLIINFFIMLTYDQSLFREVKIIAPYLKFDNRKFPIIEELLDEISLEENKKLESFALQLQMYKVINVHNLLSTRFKKLTLGDLDKESFESFMTSYSREDFLSKSDLLTIKLTLSIIVIEYEEVESLVKTFLTIKPKKLEEIQLFSSLIIQNEQKLSELLQIIYFKTKTKVALVELSLSNENNILMWDEEIRKSIFSELESFYFIVHKIKTFRPLKQKNIMLKIRGFLDIPKTKGIFCKK